MLLRKQSTQTEKKYLQLLPLVNTPIDGLVGEHVAQELPVDRVAGGRRPVEVQRRRQGRYLRLRERRRRGRRRKCKVKTLIL